jgi:hypothetical protein
MGCVKTSVVLFLEGIYLFTRWVNMWGLRTSNKRSPQILLFLGKLILFAKYHRKSLVICFFLISWMEKVLLDSLNTQLHSGINQQVFYHLNQKETDDYPSLG